VAPGRALPGNLRLIVKGGGEKGIERGTFYYWRRKVERAMGLDLYPKKLRKDAGIHRIVGPI